MEINLNESHTRLLREGRVDLAKHFQTDSPVMRAFLDDLAPFLDVERHLILFGEPGVGKSMLAQAIHNASPRAKGPFVRRNVADSDPRLLRSEWFGHTKGAFTGATADHTGAFEEAHRGTLFLDECFEMSRRMQGHFLRAFETREIVPVGSNKAVHVDCRFVFASNRTWKEVSSRPRRWRPDLLSRMGYCIFFVPPLRERIEDLPRLAREYVHDTSLRDKRKRVPDIAPSTLRALAEREWKFNLRELRSVIEAALPRCAGDTLLPEHLPRLGQTPIAARSLRPISITVREEVLRAIAACGGNKREAARALGVSPHKLYNALAGLEAPPTEEVA